jgi:hypothetical protein
MQKSYKDVPHDTLCECGESTVALRKLKDKLIVQALLCRSCMALRQRYNMSKADRNAMHKEQGGTCLTCDVPIEFTGLGAKGFNSAVIDHCHDTGKVRGMLCRCCNLALGNIKDNPYTLRKLANYLEDSV